MSYFTDIPQVGTTKQYWSEYASQRTMTDEDVALTRSTYEHRARIKGVMDQFTSFQWRGLDAFRNFGAFIININRSSLKLYNGADFTNDYNQPQFQESTVLSGISFKTQQISFQIGVYWISIEDYRLFVDWLLNPYIIDTLSFGFNSKYGYQVKLASRSDSARYVVGTENGQPMYYTEMNLTFDIQGSPCARALMAYDFISSANQIQFRDRQDAEVSDLDFPFKWTTGLTLQGDTNNLVVYGKMYYEDREIELFNISLKHLPVIATTSLAPVPILWLEYDSESGIVYQKLNDNEYMILNKLNSVNGEQIVDTMFINKCLIQGRLNNPAIDYSKIRFELIVANDTQNERIHNMHIEAYGRTNVI